MDMAPAWRRHMPALTANAAFAAGAVCSVAPLTANTTCCPVAPLHAHVVRWRARCSTSPSRAPFQH
eukprot:scaffold121620_cov69-Phaeocystis_antarctica.AAC.1